MKIGRSKQTSSKFVNEVIVIDVVFFIVLNSKQFHIIYYIQEATMPEQLPIIGGSYTSIF